MCFSRSPFFTWKKFLAKNANCITSLKIFLRRDDYEHSVVPPPRAVLWSRDLSAIFRSLDVLGAGSSPLQGAEAPSQSNQNSRKCMGSHEKSGSGALPGLVLPAAQRHCGGLRFFPPFPSAALSYDTRHLVRLQTAASSSGLGRNSPLRFQ